MTPKIPTTEAGRALFTDVEPMDMWESDGVTPEDIIEVERQAATARLGSIPETGWEVVGLEPPEWMDRDQLAREGVATKAGACLVSAAMDWDLDYGMFEVNSLVGTLAAIEAGAAAAAAAEFLRSAGVTLDAARAAVPEQGLDVERLARALHKCEHPAVPDCRLGLHVEPRPDWAGMRKCDFDAERIAREYAAQPAPTGDAPAPQSDALREAARRERTVLLNAALDAYGRTCDARADGDPCKAEAASVSWEAGRWVALCLDHIPWRRAEFLRAALGDQP